MEKKVKKTEGAKFVRYFGPLLDALRELGGSGTPSEVTATIAKMLEIPEAEQNELLKSGTPRLANQIAWARNYLKLEGYIDSAKKGVWVLTEAGRKAKLSEAEARKVFLKWVAIHQEARQKKKLSIDQEEAIESSTAESYQGYREELLTILKKLPPSGFEELCQTLLRYAGFDSVVVTGRSGDGGIDGHGILKINPLISLKVLFQSKRYDKVVGTSHIREFQGAISGRADKGIIITTGSFSVEAKKEAIRDGASPIELVDGEKLIDLFEEYELGLRPKTVYEIDRQFFESYASGDHFANRSEPKDKIEKQLLK